ncbi:MAG: hypothetical protein ABFE07_06440 [Armatimonadia bacterium]
MTAERITGVAILCKDGGMFSLPEPSRHHHLFALAAFMNEHTVPQGEQGFTTSAGRFVSREDGLAIAQAAGQPISKHGNPTQLYSEDLW